MLNKSTKLLSYRVIIEKEMYEDGKTVFVTHVPSLGISDYGESVEEALKNTEKMIKFHVESLVDEGELVPLPDDAKSIMITTAEVLVNPKKSLSFA